MVTHYKVSGHLACGSHGEKLASTTELAKVKCRNCRKTEVFTEARRNARNAATRRTPGEGCTRHQRLAHVLGGAPDSLARPAAPAPRFW